jgi:acetate kinase
MKILVANLGSTSFKYRLISFEQDERAVVLAKGGYERVTDYEATLNDCLANLSQSGFLMGAQDLDGVGFKTVVADGVTGCLELDDRVIEAMARCNDLAPAHNPPYITGIRQFRRALSGVPLVGLFETAFYQWIPEAAKRYTVPQTWFEAGIRRWGFHGASHKFIAERSAELAGRPDVAHRVRNLYLNAPTIEADESPFRVISLHLGGSSSVTGIRNGVAVGNSMGFSPQSGLPQNNRVGDLDSYAVPLMMRRRGLSLDDVEKALSQESGLYGLSGVSNDLRDIDQAAAQGNVDAQLALEYLIHQARHWMGAYLLQLGGVEAISFTAGIGENRADLRAAICRNLEEFGVRIDPSLNESVRGAEGLISAESSRVKVYVIPANEELVVAREVRRYIQNQSTHSGQDI